MAYNPFAGKKKLVFTSVAVILALIVAVGAGVGLRMLQNKDSKTPEATVRRGLPVAVDEAQNLRAGGDTAGALKKIDGALQNAPKEERYMLYIQQGNAYADKQDLRAAIDSYNKALEVNKTYEITSLIGDTWVIIGDKTQAVTAYKMALPLMPDTPMKEVETRKLEQKIRDLGGEL